VKASGVGGAEAGGRVGSVRGRCGRSPRPWPPPWSSSRRRRCSCSRSWPSGCWRPTSG
jgi:hypothetical protein